MTSSIKYVGMDVHKQHADIPIMPTTSRRRQLGGAGVASKVGIIRGSLEKPTTCHQGGIVPA